MKAVRYSFKKAFFILIIGITGLDVANAQNSTIDKESVKKASVKSLINGHNFIFKAESATPVGGRFIQLTSEYDLSVTPDTLNASLPYFGRAYTAPIDPSKGGIQFTSTQFEYVSKPKKKGGWNIVIKPKENTDARQLLLDISPSGFANLQVLSNNRQSISFAGYVTDKKKQ